MRAVLLVLLPGVVFAQGYPPRVSDGVSAAQVVAVVQDAGVLSAANRDTYANTFISTGFSADGGVGGYQYLCNGPTCKYKLCEGSSCDAIAENNGLDLSTMSQVKLPTTFAPAYACPANQNCFLYADASKWMYSIPTSDVTGCAAGTAGGWKFRSTDSRHVGCDGTTVQTFMFRASWSAALDFGVVAAGDCADLTFTATGGVKGEPVACGGIDSIEDTDARLQGTCSMSATNTARVRVCCNNLLASCADPATITFTVTATR